MTETELILELVKANSALITNIDTHMTIMNSEMGFVQQDVAVLKSQMGELMWMTRLVMGAVIGIVIERGARIYIGWKDKNNKK